MATNPGHPHESHRCASPRDAYVLRCDGPAHTRTPAALICLRHSRSTPSSRRRSLASRGPLRAGRHVHCERSAVVSRQLGAGGARACGRGVGKGACSQSSHSLSRVRAICRSSMATSCSGDIWFSGGSSSSSDCEGFRKRARDMLTVWRCEAGGARAKCAIDAWCSERWKRQGPRGRWGAHSRRRAHRAHTSRGESPDPSAPSAHSPQAALASSTGSTATRACRCSCLAHAGRYATPWAASGFARAWRGAACRPLARSGRRKGPGVAPATMAGEVLAEEEEVLRMRGRLTSMHAGEKLESHANSETGGFWRA